MTIISDRVYKEFNWNGPIIKQVLLQTADRELKIKGFIIGPLALQIGSHVYEEEVYVAPIEDKMLLGLDFLRRNKISINLGQEKDYLEVNEQKIPFVLKDKMKKGTQKNPKSLTSTTLSENYHTPKHGKDSYLRYQKSKN